MESWFSRVVAGEKRWLEKMKRNPRVNLPLILNLLVAASFIPSIYYAYINEFWPMLYCATIMFLTKNGTPIE